MLQLLNFNFIYQRQLKIQACILISNYKFLFVFKNIPSNKFRIFKSYLLNIKEKIESFKSPYIYKFL
jgi:hypothetical protein